MKGKKRPLSSRPLSYADILKLKAEAKSQGVIEAFVICCADCPRRPLCLAACRNDPARCGLESKQSQ